MQALRRTLLITFAGLVWLLSAASVVHAQTPRDFAIDLAATPSTNTPCLTLNWTIRRSGNIKYQKLYRRLKGEVGWTNKLADLDYLQTSFADSNAVVGVEYEYWMERYYTNVYPNTAQGYINAGVNVPLAESRGKLLLVIDSTMVAPLAPEIAQLQADLTGDGWLVQTLTATRSDTALNIKALIKAAYDADPANLKMVYLLGHVPVPYSGDIAPDGHGNHVGAWPADGYYGDMNGTWTDTSVNDVSASDTRNRNIPGDGKFDQSNLPSPVELMVGRVDLANMTRAPVSTVSETSLLRRYLRKAHDFRLKQGAYAAIPRRSMVRDGFGYFSGENFAIAGWSWIFTGVGTSVDEPPSDQWFSASYAGGKSYLVGCGTGGGSYTTCSSVGASEEFGLKVSRVVFTTLFGSYFGDWDSVNNFMRAPLAGNATGDSLGLTCFWGGRPNRVTHQMGMGETAGYCMMVSHNSAQAGGGGYTPNIYAGVHCGLMGDPALRLHAVEPPRNLSASSADTQIALAWTASTESNLIGYLVYRADTAAGPFTRLTALPQPATVYTDATVVAGQSYTYLVRTLKLERSPGGTYENASVGSFVTLTARAGASAVPPNPTELAVTQNCSTNAWLSWTDNSDNETGFRIERKINAGGSFVSIGTVGAGVTNFTDSGTFAHGNVYFYRVIAAGSAGDSVASPEASFEAFAGFFNMPVTRMKVSKTAGTATVTVNRFGGVTGPVSVNFATADSSAFKGTHYTATNGVLTWADGETGAKSITVAIINTVTPQAARQFKVTLSSPSAGTGVTINSSIAVLIEDPTATLGAPWSQTIVGGITDSSPAVFEADSISSVTIGGAGLTASATTDAGQFIYRSFTGDGVMTAFFPAGLPADGNARYALMARATTANNAIMAAAVTSSSTGFGTKLYSRTTAGGSSSETAVNTLVLVRWVRLIRSGNTFSAETSTDGASWTSVGTATLASMPSTAVWGIFHTSTDWSLTGLGNYHLAQVQNVTLTSIPVPNAPTGLAASLASSTSASLRWDTTSFASGYHVQRKTETDDFTTIASFAAAASTNQTYLDSGLSVNTAYAYRVVATNAMGASAPSAPVYVATAADMRVTLTPDDINGADATVQRDQPNTPLGTQTSLSLVGYDLTTYQFATNASKAYLRFNLAGLGYASSAILKLSLLGVREYDNYSYVSMTVGILGESADTWSESSITWSNAPQNNLTSTGFNAPFVSLGSAYSFADDLTPAGQVISIPLNATTLFSNKGANDLVTLGLYETYSAYLDWASREHPDFPPPSLELITTTNIPNRASFLTAVPGKGWSINLSWQDNAVSETGFTLERREGAGDFSVLQTLGSNTVSFWDTTTQPGLTYTYRLRAFNAIGPSDWTPEVTLTAATLENAVSTVWDGGAEDTLINSPTNWDFNTLPVSDGSVTVTFGTGGSLATVNTNLSLGGIVLSRDADFTFADSGGWLTLGAGGLSALLPTTTSRTYTLAANMVLATNQTWTISTNLSGSAAVSVAGRLSGSGPGSGFMKTGYGVLTLAASNSYEGVTTVSNGILAISHSHALGSTNGNTVVRSASGGYLQLSGGITVAEPLTLIGERPNYQASLINSGGSNVLSGPITRVGQTRLSANGGTTLSVKGGMTGGGGLCVINAGGTIAFYNTPLKIGTDQLYMDSGGVTIIGVDGNTWGDTQVAGGTLRMEVSNGLPSGTILKIGLSYTTGGTFDLNGFNQTVGEADGAKVSIAAGLTETVQTLYLGGLRKGIGSWGATGSGAESIDDAHFTGTGKVYVSSGNSTFWDAGGINSLISTPGNWDLDSRPAFNGSAYLTFGTGGSVASVNTNISLLGLCLNRDADFTLANSGGTVTLGGGGIRAAVPTPYSRSYTLAAGVALAADQSWGVTNNGAGVTTLTVSGPVADGASAYGIAMTGDGVLALAGNNSYDGLTTVGTGGVLCVAHSSALGSTNGSTSVALGGVLEITGGVNVPEPLALTADGTPDGSGNVRSTGGTNVWGGSVTQTAASRFRVLAGSRLTLAGGLSGGTGVNLAPDAGGELAFTAGPLNVGLSGKVSANGAGTVAFGNAGNTFGTLEVAGLTVRTDLPDTLPAAAILSLGTAYSPHGTLDLNGNNQTVAQLKRGIPGAGNRVVTSAAPALLTVNGSASVTYDGLLTGALGLAYYGKSASMTLTLSGANTYSGDTIVGGGTLTVSAGSSLGTGTNITVTGGTLKLMTPTGLADAATLRIADGGAKVYLNAGVVETVGTLVLGAARKSKGTWGTSASPATHKDDVHFSGTGVIYVPDSNSTRWDAGGTSFGVSVPENWDYDELPLLDGSATLSFGSAGNIAAVDTNLAVSGLCLDRDADFTLANGGGVVTLGGGGLRAAAPDATPRTYTLAANVTLTADQNWGVTNNGAGVTTLAVSGSVTDGAASFGIAKSGDGVLILAGDNSYDGVTSVASGGVLRVTHANALGTTNGVTVVASNAWVEIGGTISVPEPLTVGDAGPGCALLSTDGTNVWSGRVTQTAPSRVRVLPGSWLTLAGGVSGGTAVYLSPDGGAGLSVVGKPVNVGGAGKILANGSGTAALGVTGNTFGTLEIAGLTVRTDLPGALPASAIIAIGTAFSSNGTLDLNGCDQTVSQLKRGVPTAGNRVVTSAAPATLTVNGSTSTTYDGSLCGALGLTKSGSFTLTFSGTNNTFSGVTTVTAGTLDVGATTTLGNSVSVNVTGGTLRLRNATVIPDSSALRISSGGKVRIDAGEERVGALYLDGRRQRRGTYGASGSGARYTSDVYFNTSGAGVINVLHGPEAVLLVR